MINQTIGNFRISVSDGYPVWVTLQYKNDEMRFDHRELQDLEHAVRRAVRAAKDELRQTGRNDEV